MGIFDVFKTKVNEAAEKAGDLAGQPKDKVSDMVEKRDKKQGGAADDPGARTSEAPQASQASQAQAAPAAPAGPEAEASDMLSEGAPVAQSGEAAPGAGDDGSRAEGSAGGGMTQSIKDNAASGAEKAGEAAKNATGHRFDEKIDSGVQQAKNRLD